MAWSQEAVVSAELSQCLTQKGPVPSIHHPMSLIFPPFCSAAAPVTSLLCFLHQSDWMKLKDIQGSDHFSLCDVEMVATLSCKKINKKASYFVMQPTYSFKIINQTCAVCSAGLFFKVLTITHFLCHWQELAVSSVYAGKVASQKILFTFQWHVGNLGECISTPQCYSLHINQ